eukprot:CAMPEP_0206164316 /NCGR_PEP_ID=MMETSP1474-20131121/15584_1 /ASSEMBLY_ACC=CAM_ASM_001110 /TAXON_ID=97495 /ORGANISM="Imantonia sp., Strain RCC918" /LENGTH=31 /DNA_ID= /DNA_START= /DNA_END= /DNA_ORIENTATION=
MGVQWIGIDGENSLEAHRTGRSAEDLESSAL